MTRVFEMLWAEVQQGRVQQVMDHPSGVRLVRVADNANEPRWAFLQTPDGRWYYAGPQLEFARGTALPPVVVRHMPLVEWLEDHTKKDGAGC